jgi:hypothetical protein
MCLLVVLSSSAYGRFSANRQKTGGNCAGASLDLPFYWLFGSLQIQASETDC